jgi:hypothetical protein
MREHHTFFEQVPVALVEILLRETARAGAPDDAPASATADRRAATPGELEPESDILKTQPVSVPKETR